MTPDEQEWGRAFAIGTAVGAALGCAFCLAVLIGASLTPAEDLQRCRDLVWESKQ